MLALEHANLKCEQCCGSEVGMNQCYFGTGLARLEQMELREIAVLLRKVIILGCEILEK